MRLTPILCTWLYFSLTTSAPTRPTLVQDFSAVLEVMENGKLVQSSKLAMSNSKMEIAITANYSVPFGKIITQVIDCKNSVMLLAEPFFNEEICYKEPQDMPSPQQCFQMYSMQFLMVTEYQQTKYNGTATVNGQPVQVWSVLQGSAREERVSVSGKECTASVGTSMLNKFYVTAAGNLLKREIVETTVTTGIPRSIRTMYDIEYVFDKYASPASPNSFQPPNGVTCLPTSKKNTLGLSHMSKWMVNHAVVRKSNTVLMMNNLDVIESINKENLGWTAGETSWMDGRSLEDAAKLLGTIPSVTLSLDESSRVKKPPSSGGMSAIPSAFDARSKWANCPSIGTIRNQGNCGSCWAFAATESLEDRFCIMSGGQSDTVLSPEYMVDCDTTDAGCGGGFLDNAWRYLMKRGLVTEKCDPYQHCAYPPFPNCTKPTGDESWSPPKLNGVCPSQCKDGSTPKMYKSASAYPVSKPGDVATMQQEIMTHGPIEVAFFVYSDFMQYQSGVYVRSKTAQGPLGGHAVKVIGWGTENNLPYWLVANSWSPNWGDKGFFKIIRGKNECGIETTPAVGEPLM